MTPVKINWRRVHSGAGAQAVAGALHKPAKTLWRKSAATAQDLILSIWNIPDRKLRLVAAVVAVVMTGAYITAIAVAGLAAVSC